MGRERQIVYNPQVLRSMTEICAYFNVGRETVQEWMQEGAPIVLEYQGRLQRYSCEVMALQNWRLEKCRRENTG